MSRNKSLLLVGIFFVVALIFGNIFWQILSHGNDESFEKIKEQASAKLAQKQTVPAPTATAAPPNVPVNPSNVMPEKSPTDAIAPATPNPDPTVEEAAKTPDANSEMAKPDDATANWQIYSDNGFEFKYPTDATAVASGDLIRVTQADKTWKMRKYSNKDKAELSAWYLAAFSDTERKNCSLASDSTLKAGSYAMQYANPNSGTTECNKAGYFFISTDKKYVIRVELGEETAENVNKILATFKFEE